MFLNTIWEYWKKFGRLLGKIQTTIILSIIYYVLISPIGIIKNFFDRKKKNTSYWLDIEIKTHNLKQSYEQY